MWSLQQARRYTRRSMDPWSKSLLPVTYSRAISLLPCKVVEMFVAHFNGLLTPLQGVDAVIHLASPLPGRGDAASVVDVGVTLSSLWAC